MQKGYEGILKGFYQIVIIIIITASPVAAIDQILKNFGCIIIHIQAAGYVVIIPAGSDGIVVFQNY